MGDRTSLMVRFGGKLPESKRAEFEQFVEENSTEEHGRPGEPGYEYYDYERNYGLAEAEEEFAREHGLYLYYEWGAGCSYAAGWRYHDFQTGIVYEGTEADGDEVFLITYLRYRLQIGSTLEDIITEYDAKIKAIEQMPHLEFVP